MGIAAEMNARRLKVIVGKFNKSRASKGNAGISPMSDQCGSVILRLDMARNTVRGTTAWARKNLSGGDPSLPVQTRREARMSDNHRASQIQGKR